MRSPTKKGVSASDVESQYDAYLLKERGLSRSNSQPSSPRCPQASVGALSQREHRLEQDPLSLPIKPSEAGPAA
jgi:hypothetical protein